MGLWVHLIVGSLLTNCCKLSNLCCSANEVIISRDIYLPCLSLRISYATMTFGTKKRFLYFNFGFYHWTFASQGCIKRWQMWYKIHQTFLHAKVNIGSYCCQEKKDAFFFALLNLHNILYDFLTKSGLEIPRCSDWRFMKFFKKVKIKIEFYIDRMKS